MRKVVRLIKNGQVCVSVFLHGDPKVVNCTEKTAFLSELMTVLHMRASSKKQNRRENVDEWKKKSSQTWLFWIFTYHVEWSMLLKFNSNMLPVCRIMSLKTMGLTSSHTWNWDLQNNMRSFVCFVVLFKISRFGQIEKQKQTTSVLPFMPQ